MIQKFGWERNLPLQKNLRWLHMIVDLTHQHFLMEFVVKSHISTKRE